MKKCDNENEGVNIRRKNFMIRPILWEISKFQNLKKKLDLKALVNSSKRSQDQLTDQEHEAVSEKNVHQSLADGN